MPERYISFARIILFFFSDRGDCSPPSTPAPYADGQNAWVLEMQTFTRLTWRGGCTSYRRFSQLKFLRWITKFSCSAAHTLHMREVRYKVMRRSCNGPVLHLLFDIIQQIKQKQSLLTGKTFFLPILSGLVCLLVI